MKVEDEEIYNYTGSIEKEMAQIIIRDFSLPFLSAILNFAIFILKKIENKYPENHSISILIQIG